MYFLTQDSGFLKPIASLFGSLMNGIYIFLENLNIANIGLAIIIFTLITRIILHPFTIKQQTSSRLMTIIQPEIQIIQKKYEGLQDQQSLMAQQAEIKAVYEKYGTSMVGSCVPLLIQMPIIFALYRVIMNVPAYVNEIKIRFLKIVEAIGGVDAIPTLKEFFNNNQIKGIDLKTIHDFGTDGTKAFSIEQQKDFIIDFLYKLNPEQINNLALNFSTEAQEIIATEMNYINEANSFLGLNLSTAPSSVGLFTPYIIVPILAGLTQYISVLLLQKQNKKNNLNSENDQMQQTMKTMNLMMPIMSVVFCWGFAIGIGIYWIASSFFMIIAQYIVNLQLKKLDIDDLVKKNVEKANKKRAKKGLPPISEVKATENLKKLEELKLKKQQEREKLIESQKQHIQNADKFYFENENSNSLFAKANMVKKYNEKHNK